MKKLVKWAGMAAAVVLLAALGLLAVAWLHSERAMARSYAIQDPPLAVPQDAASLAQGKHLFDTRGCAGCHGEQGAGHLVMDAGPVVKLVAPNITPPALAARGYDADRIGHAVRHGVRADGSPLLFMPSPDWADLSDADTAALVAYVQHLPPSSNDPGTTELRPMGRVLNLFGKFPLTPAEHIDHAPRTRGAPLPAATVDYGRYVAQSCSGCHRPDFAGGAPLKPGTPPPSNLTVLHAWSEADFVRALREGQRPDGSAIDPFMPWEMTAKMTDVEIAALYRFFQSLPQAPSRG